MKRIALVLMTLGILSLAAGTVQAHGYHYGYGPYYGYHHGIVAVRPSVWVAPPVIAPYPVYRPAYAYPYYPYYCPAPSAGFYYQGRGLSIGVGF